MGLLTRKSKLADRLQKVSTRDARLIEPCFVVGASMAEIKRMAG